MLDCVYVEPLIPQTLDHYLGRFEYLQDASGARVWRVSQFEDLCLTGFSDMPRWLIQNPSNGLWSSYVPTRTLIKALITRFNLPLVRRVIQALLLELLEPVDESEIPETQWGDFITPESPDPDLAFAKSMLPDHRSGLDPLTRILLNLDLN